MFQKLTKHQKEKIIQAIEKNQELPDGYRDLLFPAQKKEYELTYAGKERKEDIIAQTMATPLQKIKSFGEKKEQWSNKLIFGDNLQVLKTIYEDQRSKNELDTRDKIKLIYIDPPFATRKDFMANEEKVYGDKVLGAEFLEFLRERLVLAREILADDGSIYVHLDQKKGHYIKVLLDEIFRENNFRNEIIWHYRTGGSSKTSWSQKHDTILFYSKKDNWIFNTQKEKAYTKSKSRKAGIVDYGGGMAEFFKDEFGIYNWVNTRDTWDLSYINSQSAERINYPTQKPEKLLERIIKASSKKNDIVLDFFAGSGTALAVSEKLDRKWIGCDCGKLSIYTIQKRLFNIAKSKSLENPEKEYEKKPKPFAIYNSGLYDYKKLKTLPWIKYRDFALKLFNVRDEKHSLSGIEIDGYREADRVIVFNHEKYKNIILDYGYIDDLHKNIGDKVSSCFFIVAPAGNVSFMEDYVEKDGVRYYILRIPYSIINELHNRDFENIKQPVDEKDVNNTVEAVGFDFIQIPEVECIYKQNEKDLKIRIKNFRSRILSKKPLKFKNRETLSMIMIDWDYNGKFFDLDKTFFADELKKKKFEFSIPKNKFKDQMMIIYMDIFGNEKRETKILKDFVK